MKQIEILGEKVNIIFNFSVELAFEEIAEEAFNIEKLSRKKYQLVLYMAAIVANNEETEITLNRLAKEATAHELNALDNAIAEEMKVWMHIPTMFNNENASEETDENKKKVN